LGDKKQFRLAFNSNLKNGIKTGGKPTAQRKALNQFPGREIVAANRFCARRKFTGRTSIGCERDEHPE
jgi:hypothetical protein